MATDIWGRKTKTERARRAYTTTQKIQMKACKAQRKALQARAQELLRSAEAERDPAKAQKLFQEAAKVAAEHDRIPGCYRELLRT
jgi:hypothetical protein